MKAEKTRIFGLDVMRALAILMVLGSHTFYIFPNYDNAIFDLLKIAGVDGVELFFVLSGFLIGGILLRLITKTSVSKKVILHFWLRRWLRTLPLYYLMLVVNIGVAIIIGYDLPQNLWRYLFFLQNSHDYHITFFPESWSLSIEEFAYLLMPLTLLMISKLVKNKRRTFLVSSVLLVLFFFLTKVYYQVAISHQYQEMSLWNTHLKPIVVYRLDAIFYGFLIAYYFYYYKGLVKKIKGWLFLIGLTVSFLVLIIIPMLGVLIESYPFYWNVLYLPLNSIGIALMLPYFYYLKKPHKNIVKFIEKISMYSYAMYLLHYTFILYLMQILIGFNNLNTIQRCLVTLVYLIITYWLSKFVFLYFEKPITNLRDSLAVKRFFKF